MVNPTMKQLQPDSTENSSCFQIISFDFMVDEYLKPYLIEMNDLPRMNCDELLDTEIKRPLIYGAYRLLCLTVPRKEQYKTIRDQKAYEQLIKANQAKMIEKITNFDPNLVKEFTLQNGEDNMPGNEYRRLKMLYRKILEQERIRDILEKQFTREIEEAKMIQYNEVIKTQKRRRDEPVEYQLIYPYISYKMEHWVKTEFAAILKTYSKEKDGVIKNIRNYLPDLNPIQRDVNGNEIKRPPKTEEQKEEQALHNQIYERVFMKL